MSLLKCVTLSRFSHQRNPFPADGARAPGVRDGVGLGLHRIRDEHHDYTAEDHTLAPECFSEGDYLCRFVQQKLETLHTHYLEDALSNALYLNSIAPPPAEIRH